MSSDSQPNLTFARQLAHLKRQKDQALSTISATELVTVSVPKLKGGKPVIDPESGLPEIHEKRVSKRDFVAKEHDDRIANFKAGLGVQ
jgi:hypothetical protein